MRLGAITLPLQGRAGASMSGLGKLVRTTAFKLSLAYLVIFTIFAFATLAYVA